MKRSNTALQDKKVNIKIVIAGLWTAIMFVYLYADYLSLYRPGILNKIIDGYMGPFKVTQMALISAGLLMLISIIMIVLSLILSAKMNKLINIIISVLLTIVGIANLIGDIWVYYLIYGVIEIIITLTILILSIKWPKSEIV
jgi:Family of unknown function (DUF6326)